MTDVAEQTETTVEDIEEKRRGKWLDELHNLYMFYRDHLELIPHSDTAGVITEWIHDEEKAHQRVLDISARFGYPRITDVTSLYVALEFDQFAPHTVRVYVRKGAIGHSVQVPGTVTEWQWDIDVASDVGTP